MPEITVDGRLIRVEDGLSLAAALMNAGIWIMRESETGQPRAPLCGMGVCFECRVTVNGLPHQRACMMSCVDGLVIECGVRRLDAALEPQEGGLA